MPFLATRPLFLKRCFFFLKGPPLSVPKKPRPVQEKKKQRSTRGGFGWFLEGPWGLFKVSWGWSGGFGGGFGGLGQAFGCVGVVLGTFWGALGGGLGVASGVLEWFWGRLGVVLGVLQCLLDVVG